MIVVNQPLRQTREQKPDLHVLELGEAFGLLAADGRTPLRGAQVPLARALAGEHVDGQQIVMRPPDAAARRFAVNGRPIDAPDGRRLGAVVTLDDITGRHRAEVLRTAQHAAAQVLADAASTQEAASGVVAAVTDALDWTCGEYWQVDEDQTVITRIGSWRRPGRDLSAFTGEQPVVFPRGKALPGLAWERGEPIWIADLAGDPCEFSRKPAALEAGLRCILALPVRSGGHVLGVLLFATDHPQPPDHDLAGLLDGVCAHVGRYMERRRAEELTVALAESRRQFDRIINQLTDKAWTVEIRPDGTARPVYVNTEHTTVFGGRLHLDPDDDFIAVMLRFVHPGDHDAFHAYCDQLIAGERAELEYRLIGLDGVTRWIWSRGAPRREGRRLLIDGISTDVTERRRLAEERERLLAQQRQQVERLRELDAMKDDLMAMASHELRNPIGIIRSYAEMLAEAPGLPEEYRAFIEVIDRKSDHLQNLVDDLLDLARLDAGRVVVDARPVWLTRLVRQAVDEHQAAAAAKRITLSAELPHHLHVHADPVRLRQVLDNLLSNAIKYTPDGGTVTVTADHDTGASPSPSTDPGGGQEREGAVMVTIADTGIGIPAEQYEQLFSRFFRASTARAAGIKGTGLGLDITKAIVEAIVEAHSGTVTAAPRQGGGTVFTVCLPADPSAPQ
jgi:signal transduction histidine kinase